MSSLKITGFDELEKQLRQLDEGAKDLGKTEQVSFEELFSASFMQKHTSFSSVDELFSAGGFKVESQEDFDAIPDVELNKHIAANTNFENWEDMLDEATTQYVTQKLGL